MIINILKDTKTDSVQPKVYNLGQVTTTLQDLLDESNITITDEQTIILKITDVDDNVNYYLLPLPDYKGLSVYGLGKNIQDSDLISIGGNSSLPISQDIINALLVANVPDVNNPFATIADLSASADTLDDVVGRGASTNKIITINRHDAPETKVWSIRKYDADEFFINNTDNTQAPLVTSRYGLDGFTINKNQAGSSVTLQGHATVPVGVGAKILQMPFENGVLATQEWVTSQGYGTGIPFEVQITQTVIDEPPVMLLGSLQGNRGATITPSHVSTGIYKLTASTDIFKDLKECYKRTDYFDVQILKFNGLSVGFSWYWYCLDDYTLEIVVEDGLFGSPADELLTNNVLIKAEYKN